MHEIGELIIYPGHGICRVDDIDEKNIAGETKTYYILHPIENNNQLTINSPIDSDKIVLHKLIEKDEANKILETFHSDGIDWIDKPNLRAQVYADIVNTGNRIDIARVANTLMRKKRDIESDGRKFYENDSKLLMNIQNILFKELAMAFHSSAEEISSKIHKIIANHA